jgi:hypothetical protein
MLGGVFRDKWLRKVWTELIGYACMIVGIAGIGYSKTPSSMLGVLVFFALGTGFIKVSLTATLGRLPQTIQAKGYDLYYNTSCISFVGGALTAPLIFNAFQIGGITICSMAAAICSFLCYWLFLRNFQADFHEASSEPDTSHSPKNYSLFILLAILGSVFFACFNQVVVSIPIYIHQCARKTVGTFSIPAPWFGAFGSLLVNGVSPVMRTFWTQSQFQDQERPIAKCLLGYLLAAISFGILAVFARWGSICTSLISIVTLLCVHILLYIADFHIRPTLMFLATHSISVRYHTLATGFIFACIGLGGKLAGILASQTDKIGFEGIYAICFIFCCLLSVTFFGIYRYVKTKAKILAFSTSDTF